MKFFSHKRHSRLSQFVAGILIASSVILHADPVDIPNSINILNQQRLLGEFKDYRPKAETNGVVLTLQSISDLLGNVKGGQKEGGTYSGLLNLGLAADLEKAVGWGGASFKNTWLWLYGNDVSQKFIGNAFAASTIAGQPAFRCYELWLQQNAFHDAVSLRGGLIPFDTEFMISDTASVFLNPAFGPMALVTLNLPNGGPQYPMATPGVRLALQPTSWLTLRSAFMQANTFEQVNNIHNFNWNFGNSGGLLNLNEAAVTWNKDAGAKGLPGTAKAGCWFQTGQGPQQGGDDVFAYGSPTSVAYSSGFYGIIDQQLYRPSTKTPDDYSRKNPFVTNKDAVPACDCSLKGLYAFTQIGFDPHQVSVSSFYTSAGLVYTGLIPTRDADRIGISFAYADISSYLKNKAVEAGACGASFEAVAELTYSIRLAPAIAIQPDLQYILHPGGTCDYGNALVVGMRAVVDF
jgi:porin